MPASLVTLLPCRQIVLRSNRIRHQRLVKIGLGTRLLRILRHRSSPARWQRRAFPDDAALIEPEIGIDVPSVRTSAGAMRNFPGMLIRITELINAPA
jgi:hypothetical protein